MNELERKDAAIKAMCVLMAIHDSISTGNGPGIAREHAERQWHLFKPLAIELVNAYEKTMHPMEEMG